jgi:hypothetical protein
MGMLHPAYADYAFNVVKDDCATGYYSFGHEIGHNLGLSHDHDNASGGLFDYSYGHQAPTRPSAPSWPTPAPAAASACNTSPTPR